MSRVREQAGFTLVEVLLASVLSLVILGATLAVFDALIDEHQRTSAHNDAQDRVRVSVDRFARELRNLASPTDLMSTGSTVPNAMEKNGAYDVMFKTVDDYVAATT
jgi:prepilin-type N-terminal cleavage/methylation domain-containing protein